MCAVPQLLTQKWTLFWLGHFVNQLGFWHLWRTVPLIPVFPQSEPFPHLQPRAHLQRRGRHSSRGRSLRGVKTHSLSWSLSLLRMLRTCAPKRRHRLTWNRLRWRKPDEIWWGYYLFIVSGHFSRPRDEAGRAELSWAELRQSFSNQGAFIPNGK